MSLTLLRSSYDPDPYPDSGLHNFSFALVITGISSNKQLIKTANMYNHPLQYISGKQHKGDLDLTCGFISVKSDSTIVSAMKMAEDLEKGLVLRFYEVEGSDSAVHIEFAKTPINACFVDIHEKPIAGEIELNGKEVKFNIKAYNIESIVIEF